MMKKILFSISILCLSIIILNSCDSYDGDQETPAFLKINKIELDPTSNSDPGQLTSDIRSVWVTAVNAKKNKEEEIGVFELPCTIPILLEGYVKVNLYPVVWQDYNIRTQIAYPFFERIILDSVHLEKNKVTELDSVVYAKYNSSSTEIGWYENFEGLSLDFADTSGKINSIDLYNSDKDKKVGLINFNSSDTVILYSSKFVQPTSAQTAKSGIYLELDYWTKDVLFIGIQGISRSNNTTAVLAFQEIQVSTIKDNSTPFDKKSWRKTYASLYSLYYNYFNMDEGFNIVLWAQKKDIENEYPGVYIDNIKLVYSPK